MRLLDRFPMLAIAMVLLGIVAFCVGSESVELLLVAAALTALSWYVTEGPRGRTLPRWVSNVLVVAVSVSFIVDLAIPPNEILGALGRFTIWLTLIKLFERRTARDHAHLMGLSLLLVLIGALRSGSLLYGLVMFAWMALALYGLALYQLYAGQEAVTLARRRVLESAGIPALVRGRHAAAHLRAVGISLAVLSLVIGAIVFVILPRHVGRGLLDTGFSARRERGWTNEIHLDAGSRITDSREPVLDLRLTDGAGRPVHLAAPLLLRGAVLDRYSDGRWTAADRPRTKVAIGPAPLSLAEVAVEPARVLRQHVHLLQPNDTIFAAYLPVRLESAQRHLLVHTPSEQTLRASMENDWLRTYAVESIMEPTDDEVRTVAGGVPPRRSESDPFSGSAPDAERVRSLAVSVLEGSALWPAPERSRPPDHVWSLRAAEALADYLRAGQFEYTLDVSEVVRGGEDPIVEFLFDRKRGHCEYFASALAALCRTVGIDARVVVGFVAWEYDGALDCWVVRASNAHAWVEVRTGDQRFTAVDPTPAAVLAPPDIAPETLLERASAMWDRVEARWSIGFMGFDESAQARLLSSAAAASTERIAGLGRRFLDWAAAVNRAFSLGPAGYLWLGLLGVVVAVGALTVVVAARRYRRLSRVLDVRPLRVVRRHRVMLELSFYADMLALLERAGAAKPAWLPPLAHASAIEREHPAAATIVAELARLYYASRYGGAAVGEGERHRARTLLADLAAGLGVGR